MSHLLRARSANHYPGVASTARDPRVRRAPTTGGQERLRVGSVPQGRDEYGAPLHPAGAPLQRPPRRHRARPDRGQRQRGRRGLPACPHQPRRGRRRRALGGARRLPGQMRRDRGHRRRVDGDDGVTVDGGRRHKGARVRRVLPPACRPAVSVAARGGAVARSASAGQGASVGQGAGPAQAGAAQERAGGHRRAGAEPRRAGAREERGRGDAERAAGLGPAGVGVLVRAGRRAAAVPHGRRGVARRVPVPPAARGVARARARAGAAGRRRVR